MYSDLIQQLNKEELGTLATSLEVAIGSHVAWFGQLQKALLFNHEGMEKLCSYQKPHHRCAFGRWYYAVSNEAVRQNDRFIALGVLHQDMHQKACLVINDCMSRRRPTPGVYEDFLETEKALLNTLVALLISTTRSFEDMDVLTGLPNRNAFDEMLARELARVNRTNSCSTLVLSDIDYFKAVNDTYGHSEGDRLLAKIAETYQLELRAYDSVARYGGDEFIFIFPETSAALTVSIINRIKSRLSELSFQTNNRGEAIKTTCSFGVVEFGADAIHPQVIKQADEALYLAKHQGRNRAEIWSGE